MLRYLQGQKPPLGSRVNRSHPIARGLAGCWLLNENTGGKGAPLNDLSLNGNNGTLGDPTGSGGDVPAWQDGGLYFDGGDYVGTSWYGIGGSNPRTVVASIKTTDTAEHGIVAWGNEAVNGEKWHIRINPGVVGVSGALRTEVEGGYKVSNTDVADGTKHTIASVFSGTDVTDTIHYVDGTDDGTSTSSSQSVNTDTTTRPMDFGRRYNAGWKYYTGDIYYIYIWNRALSAEEIRTLHYDPYCFITSPMRWYDMVVAAPPAGRLSRYHNLSGLGGQGQMTWDPLGG